LKISRDAFSIKMIPGILSFFIANSSTLRMVLVEKSGIMILIQ
jgi:precorrin-2 methylase